MGITLMQRNTRTNRIARATRETEIRRQYSVT